MPGITLNNITQISPRDLLSEIRKQNPPERADRFLQDIEDYWQERDPETNNPSEHLLSIIKNHGTHLANWNVFQFYIAFLLLSKSSSITSEAPIFFSSSADFSGFLLFR